MARASAGATRPLRPHDEMRQHALRAMRAVKRMAMSDQCSSDAAPAVDVEDIAGAPARAHQHSGHPGSVDCRGHVDWYTPVLRHPCSQRIAMPVRRLAQLTHQAALSIHPTMEREANSGEAG